MDGTLCVGSILIGSFTNRLSVPLTTFLVLARVCLVLLDPSLSEFGPFFLFPLDFAERVESLLLDPVSDSLDVLDLEECVLALR